MTIGEKIYTLRTKSGMTQEQLAEKMGVSRQAISKWESDVSVPELSKLKSLANLFQVTLDELMDNKPLEEKGIIEIEVEKPEVKSEKKKKWIELIQSLSIVILGIAVIIQAICIIEIKNEISYLRNENGRLASMISYTSTEPEESLFREFDYELGEINEESKTVMFSFTCIPEEYSESTKIMLTMEAADGEIYDMELQGENGIFKGEKEMPICAIGRTLFIKEDEGTKNVQVMYGLFDAVQEVYPQFRVKVPTTSDMKELEISLAGKEYEVLTENERKLENITVQLHGAKAGGGVIELLSEKVLTKEEVQQVLNDEVVKVPVEISEEDAPKYVYVKILFEHALLDGQQIMESEESIILDEYRAASYVVLNFAYEYQTRTWTNY